MGRIETGVDRLMALIADKKKVSIDQAAKDLGVSKLLVTEWAEFLGDEKLITMEYSLSKTYLKERELSDAEVEKKAKDYVTKKEGFVRKVDSALSRIQKDEQGVANVKQEFDTLKKAVGSQLDDVREELDELKKYEKLRAEVDKDITKELDTYHKTIAQAAIALDHEQSRYESLLKEIDSESQTLKKRKSGLKEIHDLEKRFEKKVEEVESFLKEARKTVREKEGEVAASEKHLDKLNKQAQDLQKDLLGLKTKQLEPLSQARQDHEERIEELRAEILKKASTTKKAVTEDAAAGKKAVKEFEAFFKKRFDAQSLIQNIDKDYAHLEKELEDLRKAAVAFDVASRKDVASHIKELEKKYEQLDKKRSSLRKKLEDAMHNVFG